MLVGQARDDYFGEKRAGEEGKDRSHLIWKAAIAPSLEAELFLSVLLFFVLALEQIVDSTQTSRYCYERVGLCKT